MVTAVAPQDSGRCGRRGARVGIGRARAAGGDGQAPTGDAAGSSNGPVWAADSETIVFQAPYEGDNSKPWSIAAVGAVATRLTDGSGPWGFGDVNGAFPPSGDTLAYSAVAPIVPD